MQPREVATDANGPSQEGAAVWCLGSERDARGGGQVQHHVAGRRRECERRQLLIGATECRYPVLVGMSVQLGLAGTDLTPTGVEASEADKLICLLGAYVERKGKESHERYLDGCD